jgi:hypothetical protein
VLPSIDHETGRDLLSFLSGEYVVELCGGKAWLYCTCLPGDTVSAAMQTPDGLLHVFLDLSKPDTHRHGRRMLSDWIGLSSSDYDRAVHELLDLGTAA